MRNVAIITALAAALLAQGCDRQVETSNQSAQSTPATSGVSPMPTDQSSGAQAFLNEISASNQLEIDASRVALEKSKSAPVRQFAQMMIDDHTKAAQTLQAAVSSASNVTAPPAALNDDGRSKVENLRTAEVEGFDDRYLDTMVDSHERAVERVETYSNEGADPAIRAWAVQTLPTLRTHLERAQAVRKQVNES